MSRKLEKMLFHSVNRLMRRNLPKSNTYIIKKNVSWSNMLWSRNNLIPARKIQSYNLLYESRAFYVTNAEDAKKNVTDNNAKLVYYGLMTSKIKGLKVLSYSSSLISIMAQPAIFDKVMGMASPAVVFIYTVMGFFTFVTPLLIHSVTKKYITEIKYDSSQDVYTFKTMTFFLQDKIDSFVMDDIKFNDASGLFNVFTIKGKPYMLIEEGFLDNDHHVKLMGFDKPLDLKLNVDPDEPVESENSNVKSATQK